MALAASSALLASCATHEDARRQSPALAQAAALEKSAGTYSADPSRFLVSHLQAAEIAERESLKHPSQAASRIIEDSTMEIADWAVATRPSGNPQRLSYNGTTYLLTVPQKSAPGMFPASAFESLRPASRVPHMLVKKWEARPGVGVPLAAKWKQPANQKTAKFTSARGYLMPVTAWLHFSQKDKAGLEFLDPTAVQSVKSDGRTLPLAADFSAPIVDRTRDIKELMVALQSLLHPDVFDARLVMLQPYDPSRIPVVLVHGLMSHPRMWRDVINELTADPKISARYQFWVYSYPTGWPIAYSAMRFREDLAAVDRALGKQKHLVLIGHSMGGLLCRLQAVSPGDALVNSYVPKNHLAAYKKLPADHIGRRMLEFRANPEIERIIFISTPHRGSKVADWSLSTWFTKFLRMPTKLTSAVVDIVPSVAKTPWQYSSISRLSPTNPLYKILETLPIQAPHHSIIGDRGRGDTPNSSDGVVAYWSSHLQSAESEVIVPDDHGAFDDPTAIKEMKRILLKNLN